LRSEGYDVVEPGDDSVRTAEAESQHSGVRAKALAVAAVRADTIERFVRPALAGGSVVVMDRFLASPLAQYGVESERDDAVLDAGDLENLVSWATGRLRPDVSVLLDRAPSSTAAPAGVAGEEHVRVQRLLTRMAAAEPHHYVVVDADGTPDDVATRVLDGLRPLLRPPASGGPTVPLQKPRAVGSTERMRPERSGPEPTGPERGGPETTGAGRMGSGRMDPEATSTERMSADGASAGQAPTEPLAGRPLAATRDDDAAAS
jgi:dTMP kinase